jgi:DNA-binding response OmpR family regulator
VLRAEGYAVDVVGGIADLDAALRTPCALVLLDMPQAGLPEAWLLLRRQAARGGGPAVVVLSDGNDPEDILASFRLGGRDWIQKPIRPQELLHACRRLTVSDRAASAPGTGPRPRLPGAMVPPADSAASAGSEAAADPSDPAHS